MKKYIILVILLVALIFSACNAFEDIAIGDAKYNIESYDDLKGAYFLDWPADLMPLFESDIITIASVENINDKIIYFVQYKSESEIAKINEDMLSYYEDRDIFLEEVEDDENTVYSTKIVQNISDSKELYVNIIVGLKAEDDRTKVEIAIEQTLEKDE